MAPRSAVTVGRRRRRRRIASSNCTAFRLRRANRTSEAFSRVGDTSCCRRAGCFPMTTLLLACRVAAIHLFDNGTMSSTDCFVELEPDADMQDALKKSGLVLNKREVDGTCSQKCGCVSHRPRSSVRRVSAHEYNFHVKNKGAVTWREPVLRMSGLPFSCIMADVQNFFEGELAGARRSRVMRSRLLS